MSGTAVLRSAMFPIVGLSVTFAIMLMTMSLMELPADSGWVALFLIPGIFFAIVLHRNQRRPVVNQKFATGLVLMIALVTLLVPRMQWEGTAVIGLAAISLVFGTLVGVLVDRSWSTRSQTETNDDALNSF